ncbi:MAG: hypothetical protein Q9222_007011 [Ikaeria aurantiellina]
MEARYDEQIDELALNAKVVVAQPGLRASGASPAQRSSIIALTLSVAISGLSLPQDMVPRGNDCGAGVIIDGISVDCGEMGVDLSVCQWIPSGLGATLAVESRSSVAVDA